MYINFERGEENKREIIGFHVQKRRTYKKLRLSSEKFNFLEKKLLSYVKEKRGKNRIIVVIV